MNAMQDLQGLFAADEKLEAIVFGAWGWGTIDDDNEPGYGEPDPPPVPFDKRGVLLSPEEAEPYMEGWSFDGGFGAPSCYACYAWTNTKVYWVTQYDGSTALCSAPRSPTACAPEMPGG